jgi:hypothetical protein
MKTLSLTLIFLSSYFPLCAQNHFVKNWKDTTYCSDLTYKLAFNGVLNKLSFTKDGKQIEISGKDSLRDLTSMFINGNHLEKIPTLDSDPTGSYVLGKRIITGKIKVLSFNNVSTQTSYDPFDPMVKAGNKSPHQTTTTGTSILSAHLPDGSYVHINKRKAKKFLLPVLEQCNEFQKNFNFEKIKDLPIESQYMSAIKYYNNNCK